MIRISAASCRFAMAAFVVLALVLRGRPEALEALRKQPAEVQTPANNPPPTPPVPPSSSSEPPSAT
jgi:hypothetical protein